MTSTDELKADVMNVSVASSDVIEQVQAYEDSATSIGRHYDAVNENVDESISIWRDLTSDITAFNSGADDVSSTAAGAHNCIHLQISI